MKRGKKIQDEPRETEMEEMKKNVVRKRGDRWMKR